MTSELFLVVPKSQLKQFVHKSDRQYFSKPVRVELSYSWIATRQLYVTDPHRGHTYPVDKTQLHSRARLTNEQRAMV